MFGLIYATLCMGQDSNELIVELKNGKVFHPKTLKYKQPTFGRDHLLIDGETKIEPDRVKYYQDESGYYVWSWVKGQNQRLKRELVGKINMYSRTVSTYTPGMPMGGGGFSVGYHGTSTLSYFQKGSGTIKSVNYENLNSALRDNQESMQYLSKVKSLKRTSTIGYLVGGALFVGGLVHMGELNKQEGPPPYEDVSIKFSPLLIGSVVSFAVPLFNRSAKSRNLRKSIEVYNK